MSPSTESQLLVAFGRAAVKAQEIEALLKETLIVVEVASDKRHRSVATITKEIENLTLGLLKDQYLQTIGHRVTDPAFSKMWDEVNRERIFLMHKFFQVFPLGSTDHTKAAEKLTSIDNLLDYSCRLLTIVRYTALSKMNLKPARVRELLGIVGEIRKQRTVSE
jgi:hypothetical protein